MTRNLVILAATILTAALFHPVSFAQTRQVVKNPVWLGAQLNNDNGAVKLTRLLPDSPADRSGLQAGDRVRSVGSHSIKSARELRLLIRGFADKTAINITIQRGKKTITVPVVLRPKPSDFDITRKAARTIQWLGQPFRDKNDAPATIPKSKVTIIAFWASWCRPCAAAHKAIDEVAKHPSVTAYALTTESHVTLQTYVAKHPSQHVEYGRDLKEQLHLLSWITAYPTVILIDQHGRTAAVAFSPSELALLPQKVKNLLAESEPPK